MGKSSISVVMNPEQRAEHIDRLLEIDGLSHIKEDVLAAYCPISLTLTPEILKPYIKKRQDILMQKVLEPAGITAYDPASAPFSPDAGLTFGPDKIYVVDSGKIVGARFFVGHNILPSTGQGDEMEKAKDYNRIAVILMDTNIRVSRMQPHRTIYLQYNNFEKEHKKFIPVFEMLKQFNPGIGFNNDKPVLLGFDKKGKVCDLEQEVYDTFPDLKYEYNGEAPIIGLDVKNPKIFYEFGDKKELDKLLPYLINERKELDELISDLKKLR